MEGEAKRRLNKHTESSGTFKKAQEVVWVHTPPQAARTRVCVFEHIGGVCFIHSGNLAATPNELVTNPYNECGKDECKNVSITGPSSCSLA